MTTMGALMSDLREYDAKSNKPLYAFGTTVLFTISAVILIALDKAGEYGPLFIIFILGNLPGVIAAIFAEKASRDIRNGTVTEKSRQGTHQALEEAGVVTRSGPLAVSTVDALNVQTTALMHVLENLSPKAAAEAKAEVKKLQNGNDEKISRDTA